MTKNRLLIFAALVEKIANLIELAHLLQKDYVLVRQEACILESMGIIQRNAEIWVSSYFYLLNIISSRLCFFPSETTLSNSRMCKQYLENKYHVILKIINNNDVYNPLLVIKNRIVDVNNERINDHNSIPNNKICQSINRGKAGGPASRRKTPNPWHVTHMKIIKDYEQRNNISDMSTWYR
ncbi:hypothetical protein C2G38_2232107 [Gigaspora rosea]|uniref:Uncharacterized protein n=1 Tax=Gigaspora rosea TaxID=44941 RepID=A0A397TWB5_9GLOM|nr:hypothetical protein C2G38_2232107 [Gigaspora rosea]